MDFNKGLYIVSNGDIGEELDCTMNVCLFSYSRWSSYIVQMYIILDITAVCVLTMMLVWSKIYIAVTCTSVRDGFYLLKRNGSSIKK